jgi:Predicted nucleotide-binding protein containing TIR-like domain
MKAKVFIGSSVEGLNIAYAIQQNIEYDCNPTVWTQGIFQLSSTALDDLLSTLENSDFGVFVFTPDDILKIRNNTFQSVRDNVIFELGLFIGKLGKEKVFFVTPIDETNLHLPTDLLGINPGVYNNKREDGNLLAALGTFCNQIREHFKKFVYTNLHDLADETELAKKIAIEKPKLWEFRLAAELFSSKLIPINNSYKELEQGLLFKSTKKYSDEELKTWMQEAIVDLQKLINLFFKAFAEELTKSFGEPGVAGNILEIKKAVDLHISLSKELLEWEFRLQSIEPPDELKEVKELMKGSSKIIFNEINKIPSEINRVIEEYLAGEIKNKITINFDTKFLENATQAVKVFERYYEQY